MEFPEKIKIIVEGDPIPKARHRLTTIHGYARQYDPQQKDKENFIRKLKKLTNFKEYINQPLEVDLTFHLNAIFGPSKPESNMRLWGYTLPKKKPDIDNLVKFVLDCGNGVLWEDDRLIVELSSKKIFSKNPCTIISIKMLQYPEMASEHENFFKVFSPEDLDQIKKDMLQVSNSFEKNFELDREKLYEEQLASARNLIKFSENWCSKLKKIQTKEKK